ncbi:helix-turn-helix domain-containing protein [Williamsia soli]|uniref:helix-turn-helix domain-containing protein n=1 Tax=Williamsia soli TaxID=364929 RepID=UPI001A9EA121|nr:hypothetical protein [Williamsia soli]
MKPNVAKLGEAVAARRRELNMSQIDVWQNGGPSNSTLTGIENGAAETVGAVTQRKLDRALRWEEGSAQRVLAGGTPTPLSTRVLGGEVTSDELVQVSAAHLAQLAQIARSVRNPLAHGNHRRMSPGDLDVLMQNALIMALQVELLAVEAVGPARLSDLTEGRLGSQDDAPPSPSDFGLAARETPPGYRKGKPTPDE